MSAIFYRGLQFIFEDQEGEHVLLDCGDFWSNKSSVPMHRFPEQKMLTIPDLLNALCQEEQARSANLAFPAFLLDVVVASRLIQSKEPKRFLEYGCGSGELSWHIAQILGVFHEESVLVCANNTIDSEWENNIAQISESMMPKLSFCAGDFGELHLEKNYFDLVFINGMTNYEQPEFVIQNALDLASDDAEIFVLTDHTPLLEDVFRIYFDEFEEYAISQDQKLLIAKVAE